MLARPAPQLAERFGLLRAPSAIASVGGPGRLSATVLRGESGLGSKTTPVAFERAYALHVVLDDIDRADFRIGPSWTHRVRVAKGGAMLINLEKAPAARFEGPFNLLRIGVPVSALDHLCIVAGLEPPAMLTCGMLAPDPVLLELGSLLESLVTHGHDGQGGLLDDVMLAVHAHVTGRHGIAEPHPGHGHAGLRPWQARLVADHIAQHPGERIDADTLADACYVPRHRFPKLFRMTFGTGPQRYCLEQRIAHARRLLIQRTLGLADVAARCGFSTQSQFNRAFASQVGMSPGAWSQHIARHVAYPDPVD